MGFYQLKTEMKIPASEQEVWDFMSSPKNLQRITPPSMGFQIKSEGLPDKMYSGLIIEYIVKPLLGIKTTWVTEITQVEPLSYFVDEQRVGPYKMWHHQHRIQEIKGGVLMKDVVSYVPPFGLLGRMANALFIKRKLKEVFDYRTEAIQNEFGKFSEPSICNEPS